jgi:flagellar hook-basal body complex protein FliE
MINFNANVSSVLPRIDKLLPQADNPAAEKVDFANTMRAVGKYISKVDDLQQSSDMSIKDLLSGKSQDITAVVSAVAKADMSFKLLVGVRNKLIDAYKQTMNMPL